MDLSPNHKSKTGPFERTKHIVKIKSSHAKLGQECLCQHVLAADGHILERDRHDKLVADCLKKADEMLAKQKKSQLMSSLRS